LRNGQELAVLAVNTCCDSVPAIVQLQNMEDGAYTVEVYRCDLVANNIVYRHGKGDGTLALTKTAARTAEHGVLRHVETLDRDSFVLLRIRKDI
jgi:hypothetical protein